jgi:arylformamidase
MLRLVDLSLDIYDKAPTFWPDPKTAVLRHLKVENLNYNISQLIMSTHLGTHEDAPYHFFDDGLTIDRIDVRRGFGIAEVLDFSAKGPREEITVADMEAHGERISRGSRLIIRTGWDKVFPEPRYFGEMPFLGASTCKWLAERGVVCVATDIPSINGAEYTPAHHALLSEPAQVLIVEGMRGLDRLHGRQVILMALPLRVRDGDGAPCRAMALDGYEGEVAALAQLLEGIEYAQ